MTVAMRVGVGGDDTSTDDLLHRLSYGDAVAFELLFERHVEPLTRVVARMVDSHHVAAELVQDVFLRVWSGRRELAVRGDFWSYLRRAARNRALDWLRREDLHREWEQSVVRETDAFAPDAHAAEQDRLAELHDALNKILAAMPERRRVVCELRWRNGLRPAAIGERLGVSLKTVETHITLGLKDVRAAVKRGESRLPLRSRRAARASAAAAAGH
jgi:RNA polymerase sigma-70 factor, ECF subfamily